MSKASKSATLSRRNFIQQTAAGSAAAFVPYHLAASRAIAASANSRPNFALIGAGGNGAGTAPCKQELADLVAICDVDRAHLDEANRTLCGGKADTYADYREVLARDDIDLVAISTPDHWHTKILVEAMRAGKDAYCEKPLTLTIDEGKLIRRVQKETGRIVQVGTQQRSMPDLFMKALAIIADGRLGKLKRVQTAIGNGAWSPELPIAEPPETLDWDRWLGPAPKTDYRFLARPGKAKGYSNAHGSFRWWYEYSGGKLTDWGAHHIDIAMLGIAAARQNSDPVSVEGTADHAVSFEEGAAADPTRYNTAQKFNLKVRFADDDVQLIIRNDTDNGVLFEGEQGRIFVNRGKLVGKPVEELADRPLPDGTLEQVYRGMPMPRYKDSRVSHFANLLYGIENRVNPIANVHSHMRMLNVCHLAGICCRLGRKISWDQASETITGDDLAVSMMKRPYREGYAIES